MNVLYVVGLGPGGSRWMTWEARAALEQAEVLCGYTVYLDLIRGEFPDKEYFSTPMTQEIERCRAALERARSGRTTALVVHIETLPTHIAGLPCAVRSEERRVGKECVA